jgi:hypothetical protein
VLCFVLLCLLLFWSRISQASTIGLGVGTPTAPGTDHIRVHFDQNDPVQSVCCTVIVIEDKGQLFLQEHGVKGRPATATNKRDFIFESLQAQGFNATKIGMTQIKLTAAHFSGTRTNTGEPIQLTDRFSSLDIRPIKGLFDQEFATGFASLSGVDGFGNEAFYSVDFGFTDPIFGDIAISAQERFSHYAT